MSPLFFLFISPILATIDLNLSELQYLADHLLPEECRKLVAAAHFKSYFMPNAVDQAEQELPNDETCLQLLLHWNSAPGEGRGETHEVLEHRLRQMGKNELADWLGKTVFHQLGQDMEDSLKKGLKDLASETSTEKKNLSMPTLAPIIEIADPTEWTPLDTLCLAALIGLFSLTFILCLYFSCAACLRKCKRKKKKKRNLDSADYYELVADSNSDSEERFDIRKHDTKL